MKITKLRHQFYTAHTLLTILLFLVFGFIYYSYQNQYKSDIDTYIQNEVNLHKKEILASLNTATEKLEKQRAYFKSIHNDILTVLKKNPTYDLEKLKKEIKTKYLSSYIDVELFLIDKTYTIYKTTFSKDLGFNLSIVTEAKNYLDKTTVDGKVYISDFVSSDALDMKYKLYSYSKLNKDIYFEMGFIDTTLSNTMNSVLKSNTNSLVKTTLYGVSNDKKQYYYYEFKKRNGNKSKDDYYKSFKKFLLDEKTDDLIINTLKSNSPINLVSNGTHTVYTKIFNKNMNSTFGFEDIIMKLDIDVSKQLEFIEKFKNMFIISLVLIFIISIIIVFFVRTRFTNPVENILNSLTNHKKVDDKNILSLNNEFTEISNEYNILFNKLNKEIELNKKLQLIDPLTKAYNRKAFDTTIQEVLSLYSRYKTPFSLILIDIDDFKKINDNYGHLIGDKILINLVSLVNKNIRNTDTLYRLGGEEFIIICKNTNLSDSTHVAEKIRKTIEENLSNIDEYIITTSIGVTEVIENDTDNTIYKRVDDNLYFSKNNGKNRVTSN